MLDLIIKDGKTIHEQPIEIGILNGIIVEVAPVVDQEAKEIISVNQRYLSAGWIDSHVHCYEKMSLYYDFPDQIGWTKGVTTVVDAGSTGENNIREFYEMLKQSRTNVLALMNISKDGIVHQDELADLSKINEENNLTRLAELPEFIIGIKVRMSRTVVGENDIIPLHMAKALQYKANHLPLMVHIGSAPPKLEHILTLLEPGDIVTHCYNGKPNGILDEHGAIKACAWDAYRRGVLFDIGHGSDSFNFRVGSKAVAEGLICQTISTDIYHRNRENGPVYDLATTLEKGLAIGLSLADVIKMVTENPAKQFHLKDRGYLAVDQRADLTIFDVQATKEVLYDSNGNTVELSQKIVPIATVIGGKYYQL
ncbi:amidohydrolase/deacetylase family metallohydrolase [Vagococcus zengguangii]|uniref:Amidohydrolase/deacetylase family metallohydrolase n=1 Tax=Vagococcus zengguangii TaxID=2571750 RepID=A0A4D7CSN0_9ENTE|nr:amidohydrolase/deacetylase family metallohydrolase [Vagococcus zengguangii]QCI86113.1 amidohydrolase/deacetylase family metallohydrolase [Vagococcus zengguangii]